MAAIALPTRDEIVAEIRKLPQAPFLDDARIDRWIDRVNEVDPGRILWHVARLRGFGGSEIGSIAADDDVEANIFRATPRQLIADKLMLQYPEPATGHTRRGTEMEPRIRERFREWSKGQPMDAELDAIAKFIHPQYAWLVGNPDDLVRINGKVYLVDYKCPNGDVTAKLNAEGLSFDYIAQLHHYRLICEAVGIHVDGMLLCSWDCGEWDIDVRPVPFDQKLSDRIIDQGEFYWNHHLLMNFLPPYLPRVRHPVITDKETLEISNRLMSLSMLTNLAKAAADDIKEMLTKCFRDKGLSESPKVSAGFIDISFKPKVNEDAVTARILQLGRDPSEFPGAREINVEALAADVAENKINLPEEYLLPPVPSLDAMLLYLHEQGEPIEAFQEDGISFRTNSSKKGPLAEALNGIRDNAKGQIDDVVARLIKEAAKPLPVAEPAAEPAPAKKSKKPAMA